MATDRLPAAFGQSWAQAQNNWNRLRSLFPIGLSLLAEEVLKQFIQLVVPGVTKINFGMVTVEWTGTAFSPSSEVKHGLGKEPKAILLTAEKSGALFIYFDWTETNATMFKAAGIANAAVAAGTKSKFSWIAIA
jgi:hypothetical protein